MNRLGDRRLLIVSGKGGVGKSTVAAALALNLSRRGLKTLVCEINTQERVSHLLGHPPAGPEIALLEPNLWAVDVRPAEAMREYGLMILKLKSVYNAVFENRLVRYFLRFIPSLQELVMLGKVLYHLQEKTAQGWRFDRIVLDAPATGHAIAFLSVPQVIIDTVPTGPMSNEAEKMRNLLTDPQVTGSVLVSLPEEMPVNEVLELHAALTERVKIPFGAVVLNALIEERFTSEDERAVETSPELVSTVHGHRERARLSREATLKLEAALGVPVTRVPRLFGAAFDRAALEAVAERLSSLTGGS